MRQSGKIQDRPVVPVLPDVGVVAAIAGLVTKHAWPELPSSGHPHWLRRRCQRGFASPRLARLVNRGLQLKVAAVDHGRE